MKANHSPELNTKLFETNLLIYDHMTTKVTEGVSGHAADFVAILAVVLTRHSHGGRARRYGLTTTWTSCRSFAEK